MAVTVDDVRRIAVTLPRTEEALVRDRVKFRVRGIVYAALSADETILGFGYPKEERDALVVARPDTFMLPTRVSDLRFHWVCARLAALDHDELYELVVDAWQMTVPKKVIAEYFARTGET